MQQRRPALRFARQWVALAAAAQLAVPALARAGTTAADTPLPGIASLDALHFSLPPSPIGNVAITGERGLAPDEPAEDFVVNQPEFPQAGLVPHMQLANAFGPQDASAAGSSASSRDIDPERYRSLGSKLGAVKWEIAAMFGYYTLANSEKLFQNPTTPHFQKEGWFGKNTKNLGVDKLAHGYSAYVLSELAYYRLKRKTGDAPGNALTAALIGTSVMLYTEFWDSIERTGGWSWEDVAFNSMGAGFSVLRNTVPGLDKKLDFRMMIVPNSSIFSREGKRHFEQQRHFFALKLSGFSAFENSPARFLELHAGYYAKDFTNEDRAAGIIPKRRIFIGAGINLRELFFKNSRSRVGRAAGEVLDYFQPPYTAVQQHITN